MNPPFRAGDTITPGGHRADEVVSALIKSIRRSRVGDAMYWASELDLAGFGMWAMRRCVIAAVEDTFAWREGPAVVRALADSFAEARKREKADAEARVGESVLFLLAAAAALAQAPKSRMIDDAATVLYSAARRNTGTLLRPDDQLDALLTRLPITGGWPPPIPPYAIDEHTKQGRRRGAGGTYDESYLLVNEVELADAAAWHAAARHIDGAPPKKDEAL